MAVSEAYGQTSVGDNWYLKFILWSVASIALFRALGSSAFGITNCIEAVVEGRIRMSLKLPARLGGWGEKMSEKMSSLGGSVKSK